MKAIAALLFVLATLSPAAAYAYWQPDEPGATPTPLPIRHVTVNVHRHRPHSFHPEDETGSAHVERPPFRFMGAEPAPTPTPEPGGRRHWRR